MCSQAFESIDHRQHILEHMSEVLSTVKAMESKSEKLLEDNSLNTRETEDIAGKQHFPSFHSISCHV